MKIIPPKVFYVNPAIQLRKHRTPLPAKQKTRFSPGHITSSLCLSKLRLFLVEAVTTINRAVVLRLERNLCFLAALRANNRVHLTLLSAITIPAALVTAVPATGRLVLKPLLGIEFLLTCTENKFLAAILAYQRLVFESHENNPL